MVLYRDRFKTRPFIDRNRLREYNSLRAYTERDELHERSFNRQETLEKRNRRGVDGGDDGSGGDDIGFLWLEGGAHGTNVYKSSKINIAFNTYLRT